MADLYGKTNLQPGFRLFDGSALNQLFSKVFQGGISRRDAIVAFAGGGKASATVLDRSFNRIGTTASANDSVLLPKAIAGSQVTVINAGAETAAVFAKGTDTIAALDAATADTIATTKAKVYTCVTVGHWDVTSAT